MQDENSILFFNAIDTNDTSKLKTILLNEMLNIWQIVNEDNLTG